MVAYRKDTIGWGGVYHGIRGFQETDKAKKKRVDTVTAGPS